MKQYNRNKWKALTNSDHVCVLYHGGLRIKGMNVTVYMDNYHDDIL
jgi:hypothetical protein